MSETPAVIAPSKGMSHSEQTNTEEYLLEAVESSRLGDFVQFHPGVRRLPASSRSQQAVSEILNATLTVMATEGIRGINTERIAQAAKMSIATIYRYFSDFESVFVVLGARLWHEDLCWFAEKLVDLADGTDAQVWAASLTMNGSQIPISEPGRLAVFHAMAAVPSMSPIVDAGFSTGAELLARSIEARTNVRLDTALRRECDFTFRMLHSGLGTSTASKRDPEVFQSMASALIDRLTGTTDRPNAALGVQ